MAQVSKGLRFSAVPRVHFLSYSGNSAAQWKALAGRTAQKVHALIAGAEWTGVMLLTLLGGGVFSARREVAARRGLGRRRDDAQYPDAHRADHSNIATRR